MIFIDTEVMYTYTKNPAKQPLTINSLPGCVQNMIFYYLAHPNAELFKNIDSEQHLTDSNKILQKRKEKNLLRSTFSR